jgi:hypothetical protein
MGVMKQAVQLVTTRNNLKQLFTTKAGSAWYFVSISGTLGGNVATKDNTKENIMEQNRATQFMEKGYV